MSPAVLRGAEPVVWDCPVFDLEEPLLEFDASRSVFEFDEAGLPPEFETDLAAACFSGRLVLGGDLAPVLARHGLSASDLRGTWTVCYPRLVSDDTLFDTMRVATALGTGPESLLPLEAEAAEEWREALADRTSPELFAHLSFFCTEGEEGLMYLRTERSGGDLLAAYTEELVGEDDPTALAAAREALNLATSPHLACGRRPSRSLSAAIAACPNATTSAANRWRSAPNTTCPSIASPGRRGPGSNEEIPNEVQPDLR
ncbi:hypothetical protein [Streptosporangium sp. NPDC049376]|uniref:hypothetical protein n=1 Tax=Streptosporangium sp. NPDC049376 TaxID=3366192 RepID=UPI0037990844